MLSPDQAAAVLGLRRPYTADAIKRAYRQKSKETHPDRGGNADAFKRVTLAKEVLEKELVSSTRSRSPGSTYSYHSGASHRRSDKRHRSYRNYDPFNPFWDADEEEEEEEEAAILGSWYVVLGVTVGGVRLDQRTTCRAQLVKIRDEYLIAVYLRDAQKIETSEVTVILAEKDDPTLTPNLFTRPILQRSHSSEGLTSAFWFSPFKAEGANKAG